MSPEASRGALPRVPWLSDRHRTMPSWAGPCSLYPPDAAFRPVPAESQPEGSLGTRSGLTLPPVSTSVTCERTSRCGRKDPGSLETTGGGHALSWVPVSTGARRSTDSTGPWERVSVPDTASAPRLPGCWNSLQVDGNVLLCCSDSLVQNPEGPRSGATAAAHHARGGRGHSRWWTRRACSWQ